MMSKTFHVRGAKIAWDLFNMSASSKLNDVFAASRWNNLMFETLSSPINKDVSVPPQSANHVRMMLVFFDARQVSF